MLSKQMFMKNSFNLFPKNVERNREIENLVKYILIALWIGCVCFSVYTFFLFNKINVVNAEKQVNTRKVEQAKPFVALYDSVKKDQSELNKIQAFQKSINSVDAPMVDILKNLESSAPSDITINSLTLGEDGKILLVGMARNEFVTGEFVASMKKIDKLTNVYLKSVSKKEDEENNSGAYINIFNIECQAKDLVKATDGGKK